MDNITKNDIFNVADKGIDMLFPFCVFCESIMQKHIIFDINRS